MSLAAAVRIDSDDAPWIISRAAQYARGFWHLISIVPFLPHGVVTEPAKERVERNLALATARNARPILQEGVDVAKCLVHVGRAFQIEALVIGPGRLHLLRPNVTDQLLHSERSFDLIVVTQQR